MCTVMDARPNMFGCCCLCVVVVQVVVVATAELHRWPSGASGPSFRPDKIYMEDIVNISVAEPVDQNCYLLELDTEP